MKTLTIVAISLAAAALSWAGEAEVVPSVGLVHLDERNVDTYYNYLAAVPVFRFWEEARLRATPLLTDEAPITNDYDVTASRLVVVGETPEAKVAEARDAYGVAAVDVSTVEGHVAAVAGALAENWAQARDVVVAPYVPSGDKAAVASASYAAALASALTAPLLYTYTQRTPYETLCALRCLGAKNVFVVDFGGKCCEETLAKLADDGRHLRRPFERPDEVESFIENHLRRETNRDLPRNA